jgi:SWI/SNF-related matrix-associated actin-dependent regulator of chromatin subfamily A3
MGLGKTITCVSLIAATMDSATAFASTPLPVPLPPLQDASSLTAQHFSGSVWGMPDVQGEHSPPCTSKSKGKAAKEQDKLESDYVRACRIKTKSRATLIICPLSTISNWEEQFREHWRGDVTVVGGTGGPSALKCSTPSLSSLSLTQSLPPSQPSLSTTEEAKTTRTGRPLRIYVYHGNSRRPDPSFLADFDAVITTFSTLATEYSKQNRSLASSEADEEDEDEECDSMVEYDAGGNQVVKLASAKGKKRKKPLAVSTAAEVSSPLQSIYWFRLVITSNRSRNV